MSFLYTCCIQAVYAVPIASRVWQIPRSSGERVRLSFDIGADAGGLTTHFRERPGRERTSLAQKLFNWYAGSSKARQLLNCLENLARTEYESGDSGKRLLNWRVMPKGTQGFASDLIFSRSGTRALTLGRIVGCIFQKMILHHQVISCIGKTPNSSTVFVS